MDLSVTCAPTRTQQCNVAAAGSLSVRVATRARNRMFNRFMQYFLPTRSHSVLDVGATSDDTYESSNYFEYLYPFKEKITAVDIDDAKFLEERYPGLLFISASGLAFPFRDQTFDFVHSSAVIEHVGPFSNQVQFVREIARVARIGFCFATPNRWFLIEFHTQLPIIHWLPKLWRRRAFRRIGLGFFADEANLNLLTAREAGRIATSVPEFEARVVAETLLGWPSNLIMFGRRREIIEG